MSETSSLEPISLKRADNSKEVTFDQDVGRHIIEFIKGRSSERVHENFIRNEKALRNFYQQQNPDSTSEVFAQKVIQFKQFFQDKLFPYVVHGLASGIEDPEITIKSAETLALERGVSSKEAGAKQGNQDIAIGNDSYVFANLLEITSRSFSSNVYQIDSKDGYVVPLDIADLTKVPEDERLPYDPSKYDEKKEIEDIFSTYADNIYSISDFESFFSQFSASFFETPEKAVIFIKQIARLYGSGEAGWRDYRIEQNLESVEDQEIMKRIKQFYKETGVVPPFVPEYQFKDQVRAKRMGDFFELRDRRYEGFRTPKEVQEIKHKQEVIAQLAEMSTSTITTSTSSQDSRPPSMPLSMPTGLSAGIPGMPIRKN